MEEKLRQEPSELIKVVLYGPESTGKTTLAKQLAKHYNTVWVPEYAREYLQKKWDETKEICTLEDLIPIAKGQMEAENRLTKQANKILISDTDLLVTKVYSEAYFKGYCDPLLEKYALANTYDLYFLTSIDVPWVKDDLRDRPKEREMMLNLFKTTLEQNQRSFVILEGPQEKRLQRAVAEIDKILVNE